MKTDRYADGNARPFDPHWTSDVPSLVAYLDDLCRTLTEAENRQRKRSDNVQANFQAAIKAIVLDLYRAHASDPTLEVGIGTRWETLQERSVWQYGSGIYAARTFTDAMKGLLASGYVEKSTNFRNDRSGKNSRTARYKASLALLEELEGAGASFAALSRHRGAEGIRLKDPDKRLVAYGDIRFANEARDRLSIINDMLESHWADLALTDQKLSEELLAVAGKRDNDAAQSFDFAARTVYRVFSNNDWEQGGRFYGAWWMSCPSRFRRHILIDGKRTVEVDYSGLHAAMLYAQAGLTIPDDPYGKCLTNSGNKDERNLVKRTFNALLNASSVAAINEIEGYSADLTERDWKSFKRFIVMSYPEFETHFGSGVGLRLQRKDSDLAEAVMLRFSKMGYACLPVHDSFIVHHGLQDDLTEAMQAVFKAEFGDVGKVSYDIGVGEPVDTIGGPAKADIDQLLNPNGYQARLQAFWASRE